MRCCGWCSRPMSRRCCSRRCRPSSASSPGAIWPKCAASIFQSRWYGRLWIVSEVAAMATDLAEFLGGAIGLSLLAAYPAHRRHGRHGRPHLRPSDVRRPRVSPDRTDHRLARRGDRPLLSRRDRHRPDRLGRGGIGQRGSTIARRRRGDDRGRHRRRDDHAARDLPAFRAHPEPGAGAQRPRAAAACCGSRTSRSSSPSGSPASSIWRWSSWPRARSTPATATSPRSRPLIRR